MCTLQGTFHLPDVDAAEHPEDQSQDESHRHGQQRGQQAVENKLHQLKHGVASYPHSVEAMCGDGLRDDIFETNLSDHNETEKAQSDQRAVKRADRKVPEDDGVRRRQRLPGIHGADYQSHSLSHENKKVISAVTPDNASLCSFTLKESFHTMYRLYLQVRVDIVWISVRRRWIHLPLLWQNGLYRPVELIFVHNYTGVRFLLLQTHVVGRTVQRQQLVTVRCALCAGLSGTPPRMESSAAWGRGDTTSSKSLSRSASAAQWRPTV